MSCIGKNGRRRGGKSSFTGNSVGKGEKLKCFGIDDFINVEDDMKILETERLLLRGLEQGDFKDVCKLLQDDEVMYAYEGAFNDQEVQNWLDRQFGRYRHDGFGLWGVVEKGSNELIGQCGITYQEFDGKRVPEIGYLLEKSFGIRALLSKLLSLVGSMLSIRLVSKRFIRSYGIPTLLPKK